MTKDEVIARQAKEIYELRDKVKELHDSLNKRDEWLRKAKGDAGYSYNVSFDTVWADALCALKTLNEQKKTK